MDYDPTISRWLRRLQDQRCIDRYHVNSVFMIVHARFMMSPTSGLSYMPFFADWTSSHSGIPMGASC